MLVEAHDEHSDLENHTLLGLVLVYVDDFMIMGFKDTILWFEKELRARWEATDLDWAGQQAPVRFCGMDIYRDWNGSYHASQRAYVRELVKRHGLDGASQNMPIPTFDEPEEEADRTAEEVRAAQQIAGELQWVATKTRVSGRKRHGPESEMGGADGPGHSEVPERHRGSWLGVQCWGH